MSSLGAVSSLAEPGLPPIRTAASLAQNQYGAAACDRRFQHCAISDVLAGRPARCSALVAAGVSAINWPGAAKFLDVHSEDELADFDFLKHCRGGVASCLFVDLILVLRLVSSGSGTIGDGRMRGKFSPILTDLLARRPRCAVRRERDKRGWKRASVACLDVAFKLQCVHGSSLPIPNSQWSRAAH